MTDSSRKSQKRGKKVKAWQWAIFLVFLLVFAWAYTYLGILVMAQNAARNGGIQEQYIEATYQTAAFEKGRYDADVSITARFTRSNNEDTLGSGSHWTRGNPWALFIFGRDGTDGCW